VAFLGGIALAPAFAGSAAAAVLTPLGQMIEQSPLGHGPGLGKDLFQAAADYIGITTDQLKTEMGTDKSMADVAVAHGKTRDGLIAALTQATQDNIAQLVDQKGFPQRPGPGPAVRGLMLGDAFKATTDYLGISVQDLMAQLKDGKTLAQIADATSGKSRDGLIQAIVDSETSRIDQAVANGRLTADQATKLKDGLTERATQFVDATRPGPIGFGLGFGRGFRGGPHP
jgi:hypothetical protein